jgi:hypothetical protein
MGTDVDACAKAVLYLAEQQEVAAGAIYVAS